MEWNDQKPFAGYQEGTGTAATCSIEEPNVRDVREIEVYEPEILS